MSSPDLESLSDEQRAEIVNNDDWAQTSKPELVRLYTARGSRIKGDTPITLGGVRTVTAREIESSKNSVDPSSIEPVPVVDANCSDGGRLADGREVFMLTAHQLQQAQQDQDLDRPGWRLNGEQTGAPMTNFSVKNNITVYEGLTQTLLPCDEEACIKLMDNAMHGPLTHMIYMCVNYMDAKEEYTGVPGHFSYDAVANKMQAEWDVVMASCKSQSRVKVAATNLLCGGKVAVSEAESDAIKGLCDRWHVLYKEEEEIKHHLQRDMKVFQSWWEAFRHATNDGQQAE